MTTILDMDSTSLCDRDDDDDKKEKGMSPVAKKLYDNRIILISGSVNMDLAGRVMGQLLALAADSDDDVTIYLNSPGGHVEAGDTIHDMIRFVKPRIRIVGTGWVASAGAHIFLAVDKKDRFCLPNTRFLLHQPSGGAGGWALDIEIEAKEILKMRDRLNRIISEQTGQSLKKVEADTERNFWLSAKEAVKYGILGTIINNVGELK